MRQKTVYLNDVPIGTAATWQEVAALLTQIFGETISGRDAQRAGSEGPGAFYVAMRR
jgi:hypothetical protein